MRNGICIFAALDALWSASWDHRLLDWGSLRLGKTGLRKPARL